MYERLSKGKITVSFGQLGIAPLQCTRYTAVCPVPVGTVLIPLTSSPAGGVCWAEASSWVGHAKKVVDRQAYRQYPALGYTLSLQTASEGQSLQGSEGLKLYLGALHSRHFSSI